MSVNAALDRTPAELCAPADRNGDFSIAINELVGAVNAALSGCR